MDVACFGALKIFLQVYSRARARAFKQPTVQSAFRATGIIPFRRELALRPDAMAPALETSVKGGFPNLLPSPVKAILDAHQRRREIRRGSAIPRLDIVMEEGEAPDNFADAGDEGPKPFTPHPLAS